MGRYLQSIVLTGIASGWTECGVLLVREGKLVTEGVGRLRVVRGRSAPGVLLRDRAPVRSPRRKLDQSQDG